MSSSFASYVVTAVAIVLGLILLAAIALQFRASNAPASHNARMARSVLVGLLAGGAFIPVLLVLSVRDRSFQWSVSALEASLCLIIPIVVVVSVGAYVQFGYLPWMQQQANKALEKARRTDVGPHEPQ